MSSNIARVHYFDRQYLRKDELSDEQAYHLAAHRQHHLALHPWGIASGLEIRQDEPGQVRVAPGYAVDGYGRALVLAQPASVPLTRFDDLGAETVAVWLVYDRLGSDRPPAGYGACGQVRDPHGFYREEELPRLSVTRVDDPDTFDPRQPDSVPAGDLEFPPHRTPPDAVAADWPVFLGTVVRDLSDPLAPVYTVDLKGRPYAGAVAASVAVPADRTSPRLILGGDHGSGGPAFRLQLPDGSRVPQPVLDIAAGGPVTFHRSVAVEGDAEVDGVLGFGVVTPEGLESSLPADGSLPWRVYRHRTAAGGGETGDTAGEQLRIEMAEGGEVVVGVFSQDAGAFKPCLTVGSDGTVTVAGDLAVGGTVTDLLGKPLAVTGPGLSADAERLMMMTFTSGVTGSNLFLNPPAGTFLARGAVGEGSLSFRSAAPPPPVSPMAAALAARPDEVEAFAAALRSANPAAAAALAGALAAGPSGRAPADRDRDGETG